ncbi:MAG: AMP-binding protein, partial [Clostridia bacterium]|nr:AMP-binding protein [Clostridia bacterium]
VVDDALARTLRAEPLGAEALACPLPELSGGDPFRIVYTSGSTGTPKGVVNSHALPIGTLSGYVEPEACPPLVQRLLANCDRLLMDAELAFSVADAQLFLALLNGKTLVLATDDEIETPKALAACMRRKGVDAIYGVFSRYYRYLDEPEFASAISELKLIVLTGEKAEPKVLSALRAATRASVYVNYGSSEALGTLGFFCQKETEILYDAFTGNTPVYLLKKNGMADATPGEAGEICIGGPAGQYGGYWNDAAMTAKKYVDHPRYGRLLRTGDAARREPDGRFAILGRMDDMVKLRGQRIELGAIEAAMEAFPGIRRAVAKIQGEGPSTALCGYYCGAVDQGALRRALADVLPYYMVPALLRELKEMPLNANGKLDRHALPKIETVAGAYAPARTEAEKLLCEAIGRVLALDGPVGIDDSFFELGGDSIRGMAVSGLLREHGYEMKLEWLFAAPTVRALAPMLMPVEAQPDAERWTMRLTDAEWKDIDRAVGRENVEAVYPVLFHAREYLRRGCLWMLPTIRVIHRHIPAGELRARLYEMQRCHTALRSVFVGSGTARPLQIVLKEARIAFFQADLRGLSTSDASPMSLRQEAYLRTLIALQRQATPDASREVPFTLGATRMAEETTVIFCFYSHLLLDAAGIARVMEELLGEAPIRPDRDVFHRQMLRLLTADRAPALAYWAKQTDGAEGFTRLPAGNGPAPFIHDEAASTPELLQKARAFCARRKVTLSALLHLAAGETLMDLMNLPQVSFASVTSGRDADSARLAGMFVNHFPMLIRRGETLEAVQEQLLSGERYGVLETEALLPRLGLPGMTGAFKLNVENAGAAADGNYMPRLMRGDTRFAALESAQAGPPAGIDGELTLMVFPGRQIILDFYYSPAFIDRAFVKRFASSLLARLRR